MRWQVQEAKQRSMRDHLLDAPKVEGFAELVEGVRTGSPPREYDVVDDLSESR